MDESTEQLSTWLGRSGYLGGFGVDYLIKDGTPLFTEVNPRFQGSTHLSCQLSVERGESCLITEHIAAFLGMPAPQSRPMRDQMSDDVDLAQMVAHNVSTTPVPAHPGPDLNGLGQLTSFSRTDVVPPAGILVEPGGTLARIAVRESVTNTGFELTDPWGNVVRALASRAVGP